MNCPKSNHLVIEEHESAASATSWGKKEVTREIALLEAHIYQDKIARLTQEALESSENDQGSEAAKIASRGICKELLEAYDDLSLFVVDSRAIQFTDAITAILDSLRSLGSTFLGSIFHLGPAEAIKRLTIEIRRLVSFGEISEAAANRAPLFAYGPELSEFRHRLR
ncbi:hypothetical protein [Metapseudomonas otitidis]|uniref:hypothetical protein n=1 Tax=Metapseudomonas otitidis TaxID=319939 RepID=UPI0013F64A61|nr:hypothetical protein [Pseudomonas otitidis]